MTKQQDTLRRRALEYHQREDRGSTCGSMSLDMDLILSGMVSIGGDARLHVTEKGLAFLRDSDGSPKGRDREDGLDGEAATARAEGIAQTPPALSHGERG